MIERQRARARASNPVIGAILTGVIVRFNL